MLRGRYFRILTFFASVILHFIWWDILLFRLGFRERVRATRPQRFRAMAARFRSLAVQMGGVMIKVGQFLSARLDVLPPEITDELAGLQDEVRAEPFEDIRAVIERELGQPLSQLFQDFEEVPMASASIGQVHAAKLCEKPDGSGCDPVVVKVQRPDIEAIVETDLSALRVVGNWLQAYPPIRKRANVTALLAEFSRSLYEEIDYLNEGKNAERFAKNFAERPDVRVPSVYWSHTTRRVLTLENVLGIKITDYPAIEAAGIDRAEVADRLFGTYLKQIFDDRFFHADPHPGNLFVLPTGRASADGRTVWQLVFVDFGMTGTVPPNILDALREAFIAVGTRDAPRVIHAYQMMGVLLPGADVEQLERATAAVFEKFWGKSTQEMVSMGHSEAIQFMREFSGLIYEMPFQVPENLILLGRCLAILSGICTGLDANFNIWTTITPYAESLISGETMKNIQFVLKELVDSLGALVTLPRKTQSVLDKVDQGRLEVRAPQLSEQLHRIDRAGRRSGAAIIFATFFLGAVQVFIAGYQNLAYAFWVAAFLAFLWMLRG